MSRCYHCHFRRMCFAVLGGVAITVGISWLAMFVRLDSGWMAKILPKLNARLATATEQHAWHGPPTTEDIGLWKTDDGWKIWRISRGENAYHEVVTYWHMQLSGQSLMIPIADYEAQKFDFRNLPARFRPESLDDLYMNAWYHETGWPFGAMSCSVHWNTQVRNSDIIYDVYGGVQLSRDKDFNPRALPLTPVWPGFAVDVMIWGGVCLFVMWGFGAARRRLWPKGDRCLECGYPRTGLVAGSRCPECGSAESTPSTPAAAE